MAAPEIVQTRPNGDELGEQVEALRAGDRDAFASVVELTEGRVYRFCYRLTGSLAAAEELAQETYLKAFKRSADLPADSRGIVSWLFTVAKRQFIDLKRRSEGRIEARSERDEDAITLLDRIPGGTREQAEEVLAVREALSKLSANQRLVLVLVDLEEYTYAEAAGIIGITVEALKGRIKRARESFFKVLEDPGASLPALAGSES